jgi:hypothetical protein
LRLRWKSGGAEFVLPSTPPTYCRKLQAPGALEMKSTNVGRRQVVLGTTCLGLAAILPATSLGQSSDSSASFKVPANGIGKYHRKILVETTLLLNAQPLFTEKAFILLIDNLVKNGIIEEGNADLLRAFSRRLLSGEAFEKLVQDLQGLAEKLKSAKNDVAAAIGSIAEDSILYVKEFSRKLEMKDLILVIAYDWVGALSGASSGAELGALIVGLGVIPGAVLGALMGAASSSVIGALGQK